MTEKTFRYYLGKAMEALNEGKPSDKWNKDENAWDVRMKAFDIMIDDIIKERLKKRYHDVQVECLKELMEKMTKEEIDELKANNDKKTETRAKLDILAKDRLLKDYGL